MADLPPLRPSPLNASVNECVNVWANAGYCHFAATSRRAEEGKLAAAASPAKIAELEANDPTPLTVSPGAGSGSAWNHVGSWEEVDLTEWTKAESEKRKDFSRFCAPPSLGALHVPCMSAHK